MQSSGGKKYFIAYMFCINPQASPECNVLMDEFVPFLQPGHKIGKVGTINNKNIINVVLTI